MTGILYLTQIHPERTQIYTDFRYMPGCVHNLHVSAPTNKGSILITTLWIMAILALLAMGIGFRSSLEMRLSKFSMDRLQARYLAKAGVVKALNILSNGKKRSYDTLYECGIAIKDFAEGEKQTLEDIFGYESNKLGEGSFAVYYTSPREIAEETSSGEVTEVKKLQKVYGLMDEERKININISKLSPKDKNSYIRILNNLLPEPEQAEGLSKPDIINAILDWQDRDSIGDAENSYYESLEHPYKCKNKDFELVEELLLVKGITPEYFKKIRDYITVYGNGRVNVNTAPWEVLQAIIVHPTFVDRIVEHRKGTDGQEGTYDDRFWKSTSEFFGFLNSIGMKDTSKVRKYFTVKSNYFRIISHGNVGKVVATVTCIINRKDTSKKGKEAELFEYYHEE